MFIAKKKKKSPTGKRVHKTIHEGRSLGGKAKEVVQIIIKKNNPSVKVSFRKRFDGMFYP